jgi:hypothetical protein
MPDLIPVLHSRHFMLSELILFYGKEIKNSLRTLKGGIPPNIS